MKSKKYEVDRLFEGRIMHRYGLSLHQYEAILAIQGGGCALCGAEIESSGRRLSVDHNHEHNFVRGVLCLLCNKALERIESVPGWADKANAYLKRQEKESWRDMIRRQQDEVKQWWDKKNAESDLQKAKADGEARRSGGDVPGFDDDASRRCT